MVTLRECQTNVFHSRHWLLPTWWLRQVAVRDAPFAGNRKASAHGGSAAEVPDSMDWCENLDAAAACGGGMPPSSDR